MWEALAALKYPLSETNTHGKHVNKLNINGFIMNKKEKEKKVKRKKGGKE